MRLNKWLVVFLIIQLTAVLSAASIFIWDNDNDGVYVDPDTGQIIGTEYALQKVLEANGLQYEISNILPVDLSSYEILFIALGKYCFG